MSSWDKFAGLRVAILLTVALGGCSEPPAKGPRTSATANDQEKVVNVVVLRYQLNSESTEQREKGFLDTMAKEYPKINMLSADQYAGATRTEALQKAETILSQHGDKIHGWFCPCEPVTFGVLRALQKQKMEGKVKIVGFDAGDEVVTALRDGEIEALVLQDPVNMGYEGVKKARAALDGQKFDKFISTGVYLITKSDLDDPSKKDLHSPDLRRWLDAPQTSGEKKYTIAVIPKGLSHKFWESIHAGALKAALELNDVRIAWQGPDLENDRQKQIRIVESFITTKASGIVLAPLDKKALVKSVEDAVAAKIPVVVIDSGLEYDGIATYVATDNYEGGVKAARHLGKLLAGE